MLSPARIIIADDDIDDQFFFREAVENAFGDSWEVSSAKNGVELLMLVKDQEQRLPDAIVLDLNMPVKDGLSVLSELKSESRFKDIPVFILSTSVRPDDIRKCLQLGCRSYYAKPYHLHEYKEIVADMMEKTLLHAS
jgi:CheY-like chemotaxis protein